MATFSEAFDEGVQTAFCQALPSAISGGLMFTALTATTGAGAAGGLAVSAGAAIAYATFCNRELPPEDFPEPAFAGGQCSGVQYRVKTFQSFEYSTPARPSGTQGQENIVTGAISSIRFYVDNPPDGTRLEIISEGGTYSARVNTSSGAGGSPGIYTYTVLPTVIERVDGLPDTCGNPAPVIPPIPPGANTVNQPVTYNNYQGDTVTNNYGFTFGYAQFNANGTVNVPVSVRVNANPRFDFTGNVNLNSGDFNINLGDPANPIGGGGDSAPDVVPPEDTPDLPPDLPPSDPVPPVEPDKPERRKILRGCIVTTTVIPSNQTEIFQSENPNIYVPDLGFISFLVQVGNKTAWTQQIKVNNIRQIIECPWINGAIEVKGTPRPNCEFTITPLYTIQTFAAQYPPES